MTDEIKQVTRGMWKQANGILEQAHLQLKRLCDDIDFKHVLSDKHTVTESVEIEDAKEEIYAGEDKRKDFNERYKKWQSRV